MIYRTSDWIVIKNLTNIITSTATLSWTSDSRYLLIIDFSSPAQFFMFDRDQDWLMVKHKTTSYTVVDEAFYYPETNVMVAYTSIDETMGTMFSISLDDLTVTPCLTNVSGWPVYTSTMNTFAFYDSGTLILRFFNLNPYCQTATVYNTTSKICDACPTNCLKCNPNLSCI